MTSEQVSEIIRDYHWMIREIARLRGCLSHTEFRGTAQYGIEASLPKVSGGTSDPIFMEVARREKKSKRQIKLENKVRFIQERLNRINDERERVVLDCLLDGLSITGISKHMGLSRKHIHTIKNSIVQQLSE